MKKVVKSCYAEEMEICLRELLDDKYNPISTNRGFLECGEFSLKVISRFIDSSMRIGHNPLSSLRKQFDFLKWEYKCYAEGIVSSAKQELEACKKIEDCDFFWFAGEGHSWEYVFATRKESAPDENTISLFGSAEDDGIDRDVKDFPRGSVLGAKLHDKFEATKEVILKNRP